MITSTMLEGVKVVELASVLAGPSVGSFLAELGATVIKVENPGTQGDTTRKWKSRTEDPQSPVSSYYASANWRKQVVYLDLNLSTDRQTIHGYLGDATFLLENFKPGDDLKFGLNYNELKSLYPNLIVGHIQGFPEDDRPAFDIVVQAEAGFIDLNGNAGENFKWPLPIVDILAAHQLKEGLLLALIHKLRTGKGSFVSVSLFDAAIASLHNIAGNVLMGNSDPSSLGRIHPNIAPYGETITSSDGVIVVLAVGTDRQFSELCTTLGLDEEFRNNFSTNSLRISNRSELEIQLRSKASLLSFAVLERELISRKIPFGRVKTVKEVLASLPDKSFLRESIEGVNTVRMRTGIFKITQ
jgi:crotonobetainyl-CoA:carnitine CoA-transferase CaiB-like acyl-CoA transferase